MEDGWRPASARPSRPSSTGQGGRDSNFSSTLVTFYGQAVYMGDAKKGGGIFGSWQGKKYSMAAGDASRRTRGLGDYSSSGDYHQHSPHRHVGFLDRGSRNQLLDAVKDRTAVLAREREMNVGAGAGPVAFVPRMRPKSARPSGGGGSLELGGSSGIAAEKDFLVPFPPQSSGRLSARLGSSGTGHLLTELNLPSVSEDNVNFTLHVEPISTSLSVDGEVALHRLNEAGPGAKFCDSGFEAGPSVLRAREYDARSPTRLLDVVEAWKRPEEFGFKSAAMLYNEASSIASDVLQGALGNCYMLGAMSVIATRKDLLDHIWNHFKRIDPTVSNASLLDKGIFTVQLYKDCMWRDVTVDTRLPCRLDTAGVLVPAFGRCVTREHMWVPLLEKAMAKLYGGYGQLEGGSLTEAMADLTGGVTHTYNLMDKHVDELISEGGLWRELQELRKDGNLMACSRGSQKDETEVQGPLGLLTNHAYAILDVKTLPDSGHRLLLVRDPWGVGTFTGKWRKRSDMWKVFPTAAQSLGRVPEEGSGSFWMSFEEMVESMTTVHICRIFPPQYHSLSVKSEWDAESSGGPPGDASWFKNPQFRLSVTQNATVVLSVVQFDLKIPERTHNPVLTGMVVLKARRGTYPVRMWDVRKDQAVAIVQPVFGREVSTSVKLSQGVLYYVVPFTSSAGTIAPFMLRCYSSSMVELQRVPSPSVVHIRSQWLGLFAGGRFPVPTWGNNPQFFMTAPHDEDVLLVLRRERDIDTAETERGKLDQTDYHVLGSEIGFSVVKTKEGCRVRGAEDGDVDAEAGFMDSSSAHLFYRFRAGRRIVIVPSTARPGISAPFTLSCYCDGPVALRKLADERRSTLTGEWTEDTSGGSHLNESWARNPFYFLHVPPPCAHKPSVTVNFSLVPILPSPPLSKSRPKNPWAGHQRRDPLGSMIGIYVFKVHAGFRGPINVKNLDARIVETKFVPASNVSVNLELLPSADPYVIVPATHGPGLAGPFWLEVTGNLEFVFHGR